MRRIWKWMGDIKVAFVLLMVASATLFIGSLYAERNLAFFMELNRMPVQDWLEKNWAAYPQRVWWVPMLFAIMGALGLNIFSCACTRVGRLLRRRRTLAPARFFHLLIPSAVHFIFIVLLVGHLMTFTTIRFQTVALENGTAWTVGAHGRPYRVQAIAHRYFPEDSSLRGRIAQTTVTLTNSRQQALRLEYARPIFSDGCFLILDRSKKSKTELKAEMLPAPSAENRDKSQVYIEKQMNRPEGRQLLHIVSDRGLFVIVAGLTLIVVLMLVYFVSKPDTHRSALE